MSNMVKSDIFRNEFNFEFKIEREEWDAWLESHRLSPEFKKFIREIIPIYCDSSWFDDGLFSFEEPCLDFVVLKEFPQYARQMHEYCVLARHGEVQKEIRKVLSSCEKLKKAISTADFLEDVELDDDKNEFSVHAFSQFDYLVSTPAEDKAYAAFLNREYLRALNRKEKMWLIDIERQKSFALKDKRAGKLQSASHKFNEKRIEMRDALKMTPVEMMMAKSLSVDDKRPAKFDSWARVIHNKKKKLRKSAITSDISGPEKDALMKAIQVDIIICNAHKEKWGKPGDLFIHSLHRRLKAMEDYLKSAMKMPELNESQVNWHERGKYSVKRGRPADPFTAGFLVRLHDAFCWEFETNEMNKDFFALVRFLLDTLYNSLDKNFKGNIKVWLEKKENSSIRRMIRNEKAKKEQLLKSCEIPKPDNVPVNNYAPMVTEHEITKYNLSNLQVDILTIARYQGKVCINQIKKYGMADRTRFSIEKAFKDLFDKELLRSEPLIYGTLGISNND